jgi:hypothetical protein
MCPRGVVTLNQMLREKRLQLVGHLRRFLVDRSVAASELPDDASDSIRQHEII